MRGAGCAVYRLATPTARTQCRGRRAGLPATTVLNACLDACNWRLMRQAHCANRTRANVPLSAGNSLAPNGNETATPAFLSMLLAERRRPPPNDPKLVLLPASVASRNHIESDMRYWRPNAGLPGLDKRGASFCRVSWPCNVCNVA